MMSKEKYQEALDELSSYVGAYADSYSSVHGSQKELLENGYKHSELLQELVDIYPEYLELKAKTTPKKPIKGSVYEKCPNCNSLSIVSIIHGKYKCCPDCGQEIDWSE